jgi:transcriptional regulator with XRE-family HTH domain
MTNRLKELREARRLSLVALAARVGTTGQEISHLELGKRNLTVQWLKRLAQALGCHPWAIVSAEPPASESEGECLALFRRMAPEEQHVFLAELSARVQRRPR